MKLRPRLIGTYVLCGMGALGLGLARAAAAEWEPALASPILGPEETLAELQLHLEARIPRLPAESRDWRARQWRDALEPLREAVLERVVFRGAARAWRDATCAVEWLETIPGGPGYTIRKLRYEALPGLWIPALLYVPDAIAGKVPVVLNVNGHDPVGKAVDYKQVRCINQARRGMLALNVEWFGMGQLRTPGFTHYKMNQLDLCGTSGVAPFYLAMKRGLDLLLALEHADPARVAVAGLSGGGWQTIFISSLDTRVKLANPVAGYSSFLTRVRNYSDLGDSEQTPTDLATVADYTHLTAMMAPRALLLTYNSKDDCCFASGHALQPLLDAALPAYRAFRVERRLRWHVNDDPGTHNFQRENREALYKMFADHFFSSVPDFPLAEIPCEAELKTQEELAVELPPDNADFHTLALALAAELPRQPALPPAQDAGAVAAWRAERHAELARLVAAAAPLAPVGEQLGAEERAAGMSITVTRWKVRMDGAWTVPVVELRPEESAAGAAAALVIGDAGRAGLAPAVAPLLAAGRRVFAADLFYFGDCRIAQRDHLFALLLAAVGERALGLQAAQLQALAAWAAGARETGPVEIVAVGPRSSTIALVAAALAGDQIEAITLVDALGSLKEVIETDDSVDRRPELFCFGLLEQFDLRQIGALAALRPIAFRRASARVAEEMGELAAWSAALGGSITIERDGP